MTQKAVRTKNGWLGVGINGVHIPGVETLAELWRWTALNKPLENAFHYLQNGRWIPISSDEFDEMLRALAVALQAHGLKPGDTMGIIASPSPWWLMMDLAVQSIGAISVPLFPNISIESFDFQVEKAKTHYLFIDQDRDLSEPIRERLAKFDHVIALRTSRSGYTPIFFDDLIAEGRKILKSEPKKFEEILPPTHPDDVATIIFTSGSNGLPKGVQLTHRNILSQMRSSWGRIPFRHKHDIALSGLPLAHSFERTVVYFYMSCGTQIFFADDTRRLGELLQGVSPHILTVVPRLLDKVMEKMRANANASKSLEKWFINSAIDYAIKSKPKAISSLTDSHILSPIHLVYDRVVYKKMRMALGGNLKVLISGGAKLTPQTFHFFLNIGLPICEGYGLTEGSPIISVNEPWDNDMGSVGYPLPDIEVKLSEEGELILRGENVMKGYLDDPKQTEEVIDSEGWLHTGDRATIDRNGRISIVGRLKELFKTSNGKYVSPAPIEQKLSEHPLIDMVMVVADGRKFPIALLFPSEEGVIKWQKERSLSPLSMEEFWSKEESQEEISNMVEEVNASLTPWERLFQWKVVTELPTVENSGLTPTLKIKRSVLEKRHADLIDALYEKRR